MHNVLIVGGARGVGLALGRHLAERGDQVHVTSRSAGCPPHAQWSRALDLTVESSIVEAVGDLPVDHLDLVVCTAGLLHDGALQPEKRLEHVDPAHLARVFAVNATGPLLLAKHVMPLMRNAERPVFASLSARVGSIGDNRLGGWYGYRASKAAQNMFTKTLAIEWSRRMPQAIAVGLHPGTVATDLSAPFRGNVPAPRLFSAAKAASYLVTVLDGLTIGDSGTVLAWDGRRIPA